MSPRRALARIVVAAFVAAAAVSAAGDPPRARSEPARRAAIEGAAARLLALEAKAKADARTARVDAYLALGKAEDFASSRRPHPAELVEYMTDDDAPMDLRTRARDALKSMPHRNLDPDLQVLGEGHSRRAAFCREKLVPLLLRAGEKAEMTRTFVAEILASFWYFQDPAILAYDPK